MLIISATHWHQLPGHWSQDGADGLVRGIEMKQHKATAAATSYGCAALVPLVTLLRKDGRWKA